jgi:hypothetical protein
MLFSMIAYFFGMFFYIFCDLTNNIPIIAAAMDGELYNNFLAYYFLEEKTNNEITIVMIYYTFTSISTVGFGDFAPRSNVERCFIAIFLLIGVSF